MYYAVFAIDSWHLANGVHCPTVKVSNLMYYSDVVNWCANQAELYKLRDSKDKKIDAEYIADKISESDRNDTYCSISFDYPREGEIVVKNCNK